MSIRDRCMGSAEHTSKDLRAAMGSSKHTSGNIWDAMGRSKYTSEDLCAAIETGSPADVWVILAYDVDPNVGADGFALDEGGCSPRDRAFQGGFDLCVQFLDGVIEAKKTQKT